MKVHTINDASGLEDLCTRLGQQTWLAVDTEFERHRTYYPELCLVQIASRDATAIIDPLALPDLQPLLAMLYEPSITKVFHAARQDLELFYHLTGAVPGPVFDTQLAAAAAGYDDQIAYSRLVQAVTGRELEKTSTRSDWKQRPLSAEQIHYAAEDVHYLVPVYEYLHRRLSASGRLDELAPAFAALQQPGLYAPDPKHVWKRIRLRQKLEETSLTVLKNLAAWRETTARRVNKPRNWLLKDAMLVELARRKPQSFAELSQIRDLGSKQVARYGKTLLGIIRNAG